MSRIAPAMTAHSQLRTVAALGLKPLRLRGGRPPQPLQVRLRVQLPEGLSADALSADPLWPQLLRALQLGAAEVSFKAETLPTLNLPALSTLRSSPAAKRTLWPQLRALRRDLVAST
jgi:DNA polymerase III psi subunit